MSSMRSHKHLLTAKSLVNSRRLRRDMTDAERAMWKILRGRRLAGLKFRRQFPIGPYIADFCCFEKRLVIELDGGQHLEQKTADSRREKLIRSQGFRLIRFWNAAVFREPKTVVDRILSVIDHSQ